MKEIIHARERRGVARRARERAHGVQLRVDGLVGVEGGYDTLEEVPLRAEEIGE